MFTILAWIVFGLLVGLVAKIFHPGPIGFIQTVLIGIAGSFVGGLINWFLEFGKTEYHPSGFIMSTIGAVIFCVFWRWYTLRYSEEGPKSFFNGKKLR